MAGFEEFLAGKAKVMGESSGISSKNFPPFSHEAASRVSTGQKQGGSSSSAADLGTAAQPSWHSLFSFDPSLLFSIVSPQFVMVSPLLKFHK